MHNEQVDNKSWKQRSDDVFIGTYGRHPAAMVRGEGCYLYDADGNQYLDFLSGIAVCSLGHCNQEVTKAVSNQAAELVHVSNLYYTKPQTELAELLIANSFADKVFMANSGAEVNEAAIKLARIHGGEGRYEIISLSDSFHGRTLASLAATGQPKFHKGFEPIPDGFAHAPFGDIAVLADMISDKTCAILCEPLQGEGGVRPLSVEYLKGIRYLCDKHNLLLIFDEIQTGIGRTGTLFAYEQLGVVPDIMTIAKALGNGLPVGALLTTNEIALSFSPGTHGSTFGGNPIASAAATVVMKTMLGEDFLNNVLEKGKYLQNKLSDVANLYPSLVSGVRGMGLIQGLVLTEDGISKGADMVNDLFDKGYIINFAGNKVLRFLPPLIVSYDQIDELVDNLAETLGKM